MQFRHHLRSAVWQAVAAVFVATCGAGSADAGLIITNLNGNDGDYTTLVGNLDRSKALGFTMPATGPYSLDSAVMRLDVGDTTRTIAAGLYGSTVGVPSGSALVTFNIPAFVTGGVQNYTFVPNAPFVLQPSTTYFLVAYGTLPGSSSSYIDWLASDPAVLPTGVATYAGAFSDNSGAVTVPPTNVTNIVNSFAINATAVAAVPEPSTLSMSILGALCTGAIRRLRVGRREPTA